MFIIISIILTAFAYQSFIKNKQYKTQFIFISHILTAMLCLRYGQGPDYNEYLIQYDIVDSNGSFLVNALYHGEIGWYMLLLLMKKAGLSFEFFICMLSLLMMIPVLRMINRNSPYKFLSLLLFYPTYYMTYCYSAIRQGVVACLFISIGLELLLTNKYKKYFILIGLLCLIHKSAIVLFLAPFMSKINMKKPYLLILPALASSLIMSKVSIIVVLSEHLTAGGYMEESFSIGAIAMRLILFTIIYVLYKNISGRFERIDQMYNLYFWGFIIYLCLSFSGNLSQRLTVPFKIIETLLIPTLLYHRKFIVVRNITQQIRSKLSVCVFSILLLMNVEIYKNLNSYIWQANYYDWVNPVTYPYISVFNKNNIWQYITHFDE